MYGLRTLTILVSGVVAASAQEAPRGNWQTPGPIQRPGAIQSVGEIQTPGEIQKPGEIKAPTGRWLTPGPIQSVGEIQKPGEIQTPGEIQAPKARWVTPGPIQKAGEIRVPQGIEAVRSTVTQCENRLSMLGDALFDFDKANLRPDAEATLQAALPEIAKSAGHPARVEGHTDGKGGDAYNMKLSEARGRTVRDWLSSNGALPESTPIRAFGKRKPIAPNATPDGRDDPEGRQKNRRVEIVFETCRS